MTVYIIANVTVHDPEPYKGYSALVPETLSKYGGWYVGRAGGPGDADIIEGDFQPARFVILAFDSKDAALRWYNSEEYQAAAEVRRKYSDADIFIIDEVPADAGSTRAWGDWR